MESILPKIRKCVDEESRLIKLTEGESFFDPLDPHKDNSQVSKYYIQAVFREGFYALNRGSIPQIDKLQEEMFGKLVTKRDDLSINGFNENNIDLNWLDSRPPLRNYGIDINFPGVHGYERVGTLNKTTNLDYTLFEEYRHEMGGKPEGQHVLKNSYPLTRRIYVRIYPCIEFYELLKKSFEVMENEKKDFAKAVQTQKEIWNKIGYHGGYEKILLKPYNEFFGKLKKK